MTDPTPDELFRQMGEKLARDPNRTAGMNAKYQFRLTGEGGGEWYLRIADGKPEVGKGTIENPDNVQTMTVEDYVALATGKVPGQELFFSGRMKVEGDGFLGMKLGQILAD
ncbi:MAG: SCP2 sterol-binding domain-containing protein [Candidatus Dormibacteraeota bacterium]|nr:SCP2 sterol-binding domain-containing protein [Candidatus Dormibacteraeota bacterium]MBV9525181.1 SCP2 sterol-binding domain-containing protein [Candidatus Dormibacteraeota bacterium]